MAYIKEDIQNLMKNIRRKINEKLNSLIKMKPFIYIYHKCLTRRRRYSLVITYS